MLILGKNQRLTICAVILAIQLLASCGSNQSALDKATASKGQPFAGFTLRLTDAPLNSVASVNIDIGRIEIFAEMSGRQGRIILAENIGLTDLLQLRNGVLQTLGDLALPAGLMIHQIRLILNDNNHVTKTNGSRCEMKTPSAQHSGVKLLFTRPLITEAGYNYNLVLDFDAEKSVVVQGNGRCLLKPVIKVKSASRSPIVVPEPSATPSPTPSPAPVATASPTPAASPAPTAPPPTATPTATPFPEPSPDDDQIPVTGETNDWSESIQITDPPIIVDPFDEWNL